MLALETTASIDDHRLVIQDAALPAHAEHARVIVMWDQPNQQDVARHRQRSQAWAKNKATSSAARQKATGKHCPDAHIRKEIR
jgi:hypothetical protein